MISSSILKSVLNEPVTLRHFQKIEEIVKNLNVYGASFVVWHNSLTLCIVLVYQGLRCTYMHLPWRLKQCAFCLSLCCRCKQRSAEEECVEVIVASWMVDDVFLWSDHDSSTGAQQSVRPRCFLYFSPSWPSAASSFHTPCTSFCWDPGTTICS